MKKSQTIKRNKLGAFVMTMLIVAYIAPLCIACAGAGELSGTGNIPNVPGVPDNAVQYNKTDITPVSEMEQVKAGELALFCYRNMTLLMNCSRNCEIVLTVDPEVTPKILGLSIDSNQTMTLTMNMYSSPLQGEMVMERTLNFYLGIESNATLQLSAQIRLHINQTQFDQELNRVVNASRLTWMYWNRSRLEWVPVESHMDQNGYLVCNTNHFSTWTVAEITPKEDPTSYGWTTYAMIGVVVAVISIVAVAAIVRRRKE
jgi:hypothetical protein